MGYQNEIFFSIPQILNFQWHSITLHIILIAMKFGCIFFSWQKKDVLIKHTVENDNNVLSIIHDFSCWLFFVCYFIILETRINHNKIPPSYSGEVLKYWSIARISRCKWIFILPKCSIDSSPGGCTSLMEIPWRFTGFTV